MVLGEAGVHEVCEFFTVSKERGVNSACTRCSYRLGIEQYFPFIIFSSSAG